MIKKLTIIFVLAAVAGISIFFITTKQTPSKSAGTKQAQAQETYREVPVSIENGDTFGVIAESAGIPTSTVTAIIATTTPVYDLASIRAGKKIVFYFDRSSDELKKVSYEPTTETELVILRTDQSWHAEKKPIQYEIRTKKVSGTIASSLYETALEQNMDTRAIIGLADMFAWQIDFAVDIRKNDTFTMIYEERYRDNVYVMPGNILAATFDNDGTILKGYYYKGSDDSEGYFDPEGKSMQKILLKSPLQYRYISSGYTNRRVDPITRSITPHRAIDYAAAYGTPAVSVGDGTVVRAGWNGGYGISVDVRHNETYMTRYGHFSKLAVKAGQKVKQGQIIGYVGSTGHSTGPHLHYELYKFGTPVNPFTIELPSEKGLASTTIPIFQDYIKQFIF